MMQEVSIYIESSIHCRQNRDGYIGYVLEYYPEGRKYPKLLPDYMQVKAMNTNRSQLEALICALGRMKKKCILSIYTESDYLYSGFAGNEYVQQWVKNGWMTSRGTEVKNRDKWQRLTEELQGNMYRFMLKERNAYTDRIKEDLQQLEDGSITLEALRKKRQGGRVYEYNNKMHL